MARPPDPNTGFLPLAHQWLRFGFHVSRISVGILLKFWPVTSQHGGGKEKLNDHLRIPRALLAAHMLTVETFGCVTNKESITLVAVSADPLRDRFSNQVISSST